MPLPSQMSRDTLGSRAHVFRRKSKGPVPIAVMAVAGVCAAALLYVVVRPLLFTGPSRADGAEGTGGEARQDPAAAAPQTPPGGTRLGQTPTPNREGSREQGREAPAGPRTPQGSGSPEPIRQAPVSNTPTSPTPVPSGPPATLAVTPAPNVPAGPSDSIASALRSAEAEASANRPVVARQVLLRALARDGVSEADKARLRERIGQLNQEVVFSPRLHPDDTITAQYVVQSGDTLSRIVSRQGLAIDWRAIQRVNGMASENIRVGQRQKLLRGPFHAVVDKSDYRLDLYAGPPDSPEEWVFVRSFPVGLGADNGTPVGTFIVKRHSRLINPEWVNPETGQRFAADDPLNPIGERWVGIRGLGDSAIHEGFGIHGTIEPDSIGKQRSMGCVRMHSADVEVVYELLIDEVSRVNIVP